MLLPQNAARARVPLAYAKHRVTQAEPLYCQNRRISGRRRALARVSKLFATHVDHRLGRAATCRRKRALDMLISAAALIALLPLLVAIAALVKLSSKGPVLFAQQRTGLSGRHFKIYKFRTMTVVEDGKSVRQACRGDSRITPIGAFLRRSSLDELPQFWNVLIGDMSLVGPRPHALAHDIQYGGLITTYGERFRVRPGITGLAQCNGARGPTETLEKMHRRVELDNAYIERWSWAMEFRIVLKTAKLLAFGDQHAF